ncbi:hypothetical protein XENOCAPTIV_020142, partial [Xenoophorus captivus]
IESEMKGCLDFLRCVYDVFGFSFQLYLSTRPEKYLGDIAVWDQAEKNNSHTLVIPTTVISAFNFVFEEVMLTAVFSSSRCMRIITAHLSLLNRPLWLSPRQVCKQFTEAGFMADADLDSGCLLNKKIRNAQLAQYNFILVVGEKEKMTNSVNVRTRDNKVHGELPVSEVIARLTLLKQSRCRNAEEEF